MFKKSLIAGVLFATVAMSNAMGWGTDAFPLWVEKMPRLVNILEAGGGPHFFNSKMALRRALGDSRADDEINKLITQFGDGRVYRFFAVSDFMMMEAFRIASVQWGTPYNPTAAAGLPDFSNSKEAMDDIMGSWLHEMVMKRADEKFGPGASDNFHLIADALGASVK